MQKTQYMLLATIFMALIAFAATTTHAADTTLQVVDLTLQNHKFSPAAINVPAGKPFIIRLKNADKTPSEFESHDMKAEKIVGGGKTISIRIRALKAGNYTFFDEFHEKTTRGTLTAE